MVEGGSRRTARPGETHGSRRQDEIGYAAAMRDDRVLLLRGLVAALRGDEEQARARMSDLLARDPNNVRAVLWWRHELDRL